MGSASKVYSQKAFDMQRAQNRNLPDICQYHTVVHSGHCKGQSICISFMATEKPIMSWRARFQIALPNPALNHRGMVLSSRMIKAVWLLGKSHCMKLRIHLLASQGNCIHIAYFLDA